MSREQSEAALLLARIQQTPGFKFTQALSQAFHGIIVAQKLAGDANEARWLGELRDIQRRLATILQSPPSP